MRFCCLASGSEGNSTLVESHGNGEISRILVDCGLSFSLLKQKLLTRKVSPEEIDGVFITHEHADHCKGLLPLVRELQVPIFMTYGTFISSRDIRKNVKPHFLSPYKEIKFGNFVVEPFPVPHDARESIALKVEDMHFKLGILTDLGTITKNILATLQDVDALILEFNYDDSQLKTSSYPESLKQRIASKHGHLSNHSAVEFAKNFLKRRRKVLVAAHLSSSNNSQDIVSNLLDKLCYQKETVSFIADQNAGTPWITLD